ncbi:MAG TPA: hypothetical protein VLX92_15095 [Kofleriaceae bacterium]|nr:hypothetical protein [Kofleriaceae bacterium]
MAREDDSELEAAHDRAAALARENAELRIRLAALEGRGAVVVAAEHARRRRVASVMLLGGGIAIVAGIFASSLLVALLGAGWVFGGAAVASTVPQAD